MFYLSIWHQIKNRRLLPAILYTNNYEIAIIANIQLEIELYFWVSIM